MTTSSVRRRAPLSIKKKLLFSAIVLSCCAIPLYLVIVTTRTYQIYRSVKDKAGGWRGRLFAADPLLGFAPIPNARGTEVMSKGPEVPARFDREGFRVPASDADVAAAGPPRAIALGCSFTYGAACPAEETYPFYLSNLLGFRCINAGVPSYGLAQMLILARRLIPRYKPKYVIVQYSPWLVERSQRYYAPTFHGLMPGPYFTTARGNRVSIHRPVFAEIASTLPVSDYRGTRKSVADFASFWFRVGLPLFPHDDFHRLLHEIKRLVGITPRPATDGQRIVDEAYGEISKICEENHAQLIVVVLGLSVDTSDRHVLDRIPHAVIVDAQRALIAKLPEATSEAYIKTYCHWSGYPPSFVDGHPNQRAHWIIALELATAIGRIGK